MLTLSASGFFENYLIKNLKGAAEWCVGEALPQPVPGLWGFLSALDQLLHCSPGREGRAGQLLPPGCGWGLWGRPAVRAGVSGRGCLWPGGHSAFPGKGAASAAPALELWPRLGLCLGRGVGSTEPSDPCGASLERCLVFFSPLTPPSLVVQHGELCRPAQAAPEQWPAGARGHRDCPDLGAAGCALSRRPGPARTCELLRPRRVPSRLLQPRASPRPAGLGGAAPPPALQSHGRDMPLENCLLWLSGTPLPGLLPLLPPPGKTRQSSNERNFPGRVLPRGQGL